MKRSETSEPLRGARQEYIETRWTQLSELSTTWGEESIKYLLLVNTGAMAGTLSFIGAMPHIRPLLWPKVALSLFVVGVVLVGVYHAVRYHRIEWLFSCWRKAVAGYSSDQIDWNEVLDGDDARSKRMTLILLGLAYLSMACFLSGLGIAGANFNQITNPPPKEATDERTKTTTSTEAIRAAPANGPRTESAPKQGQSSASAPKQGQSPAGHGNSDSEPPASRPGSDPAK